MDCSVLLRRFEKGFWATIRPMQENIVGFGWAYDTPVFETKKAALDEARAFANWKGYRVKKIVEEK